MSWFQRVLGRSGERRVATLEFEALIAESEAYLSQNLMIHQQTWQFGSETGFKFDPQTGLLTFTFDGGRQVRCPAKAVGSLDTQAGAWAWAWANPSICEDLRRDVEVVKAHGESHGFAWLTRPSWPATTEQAWQMTAVAAKLCEHPGAFAMTSGPLQMFLIFREVYLDRFELGP
ncbi:MAG TPA: hypothetical protein VGZ22_14075 [Isosphaeraceae bacterium]|jgi:hypothetical protein|nr:hypothetical protein [Isosphaeraceae bacterium]